ncbi:extracellular solute-binding protein [Clostridium sp. MCC353]|uniref:ABC transporter substrate-binding protein n=1 Tax=Clostridium sp. MCC353 TaxID=2592646 RepID=UPI001C019EA1|nr:sugar ABC transporter substrate-binding protein [Clostridium sp. MCC353]MBT9778993.1 extracellular solute-binding protein [Clostridium sp. MCC353]
MRSRMKRVLALGLAGVMVGALAACGSADNKADQASSAPAGSTNGVESTVGGAGAPVTLKFSWWGNQNRHDYTQKILDKYTELHPNVTFEAMPSGWDGYFDKLSTQAASGSMPDIVQMDYLYITTYAKNNSLADMQPYIDNGAIDVSGISEAVLNTGKIDGKLAGVVGATGSLAVGYNPEVFKEAGLEEPNQSGDWTWDDFVDTAKKVKETTGKLGVTTTGVVDDTNLFNYWVRQHGEQLFSDDKRSLGYKEDQIFVDYLNLWKDLMDAGAAANPDEYAQIQTLGQEAGPVVTGDAAMINENNNYASKLSSRNSNLKITTPPVNSINPKAMWNKPGYFLCISDTSKVKDEAAAFISWFLNSEEANDIMMAERGVPSPANVREFLINSGKMDQKQNEMFEYADTVLDFSSEAPAPDPIGIAEVGESFKNCAYKAFYGQISTEEAAANFRKEADEILARNN